MKKKEIISIIIIPIVLAAILFGAIYLANRHRFDTAEKNTIGIISYNQQIQGNYIYFNHYYNRNRNLLCFDTSTDTLTKLCTDPRCDGYCPLESATLTSRIYKNRLYFEFFVDNNVTGLAYYDINSQNTRVIKNFNEILYQEFFIYNNYIYFFRDGYDNYDDNGKYKVCRISINGGKEETLIELDKDEMPMTVADGKIYTSNVVIEVIDENYESPIAYTTIYAYDVNTLERQTIWESDRDKYLSIGSRTMFYNGKLYFEIYCNNYTDDSYPSGMRGPSYLYCLDTQSRSASRIFATPVYYFTLAYDGIYIVSNEYVGSYTETNQFGGTENKAILERKIYKLDFCGSNLTQLYYNPDISYYNGYFANGKFIGQVKYSGENKVTDHFVVIDLSTGTLSTIKIPE